MQLAPFNRGQNKSVVVLNEGAESDEGGGVDEPLDGVIIRFVDGASSWIIIVILLSTLVSLGHTMAVQWPQNKRLVFVLPSLTKQTLLEFNDAMNERIATETFLC